MAAVQALLPAWTQSPIFTYFSSWLLVTSAWGWHHSQAATFQGFGAVPDLNPATNIKKLVKKSLFKDKTD